MLASASELTEPTAVPIASASAPIGSAPDLEAFFVTKKGVPVARPVPSGPIADSHTHLSSLHHIDPALALARAALCGVRFIADVVDPTDDATDPAALFADLAHWEDSCAEMLAVWSGQGVRDALGEVPAVPDIRILAGCHPHNAARFDDAARATLRELLAHPLCGGMGEIGLDYHYDLSPRDVQQDVFREQLMLAVELDLPLSLHIREAHPDAARIMAETGVPAAGAVLHCFDLGPDDARPFQEMGCILGIGGAVTFNRCEPTREAVLAAPADAIVTETDAPYMAPEPLRGTRCEPAMVALSARFVADLRADALGEDPAAFYAAAYERARDLFDRPDPSGTFGHTASEG